MAITSRTAAARIEQGNKAPNHGDSVDAASNISADLSSDPFYFDFGYGDDPVGKADSDMLMSLLHDSVNVNVGGVGNGAASSTIPILPLPFDDIPSPVPLRDIIKREEDRGQSVNTNFSSGNGGNSSAIQPRPVFGGKQLSKLTKSRNKARAKTKTSRKKSTTVQAKKILDEYDENIPDDDERHVKKPKPEDVLSVRGVGHSKNPGNLKFRELVNSKKSAYERNTCPDFRRSLAVDIVAQLKPGRFLKKEDITQRVFKVMDYDAAVTKALFAVRDVKISTTQRKAPSSSITSGGQFEGKRKKQKSTVSKQKQAGDVITNCTTASTTKRSRPKRKASEIAKTVIKNATRYDDDSSIVLNLEVQPSCLAPNEIEDIEDFIEDSVKFNRNIYASEGAERSTRSGQIHNRIEEIVAKGAEARKKKGDDGESNWFNPERQREVRLELLNRCRAAMETGMSFGEFFNRFEEGLTL